MIDQNEILQKMSIRISKSIVVVLSTCIVETSVERLVLNARSQRVSIR